MRAHWKNLASLAGAAVLAGCTSGLWAQAPAPAAATKAAAVVNGEVITEGEIDSVANMIARDRFKLQTPSDQQRGEVRMEVMSMTIDDVLMRQFLVRCNIKVEPAEIDKQLADLLTSLKSAKPPKTLPDFLHETNQTEAQLRGNIITMLSWAGFVQTRVNEAEVHKYYEANKEFFDQVQVRASHILIRLAPNAPDAERQAAVQKLQFLRAEIVAGRADFAEVAKQKSQCQTASTGGDLGFFPRKWYLPEPLAKAAFALQIGEVSDVVATELGVHLIKVTDRKKGEPSSFEKIKDEARDSYIEELRQQILVQERKTAKIEVK